LATDTTKPLNIAAILDFSAIPAFHRLRRRSLSLINGSGAVLPDGERDEASAGFLRNVPPDQPSIRARECSACCRNVVCVTVPAPAAFPEDRFRSSEVVNKSEDDRITTRLSIVDVGGPDNDDRHR
jgi:hypothetical protein